MPTLAVMGTGRIGSTVARLAIAAGYDVTLANSRGPESLAGLVAELGPHARATSADDVTADAELVVVAVPAGVYAALPMAALAERVIIDTSNYNPGRDGDIPALDDGSTGPSMLLQQLVGSSPVVKAFNTIFYLHLAALARPHGAADRSTLPIAGDDTAAKTAVSSLLDDLGYDTLDIGPLSEEWRIVPGRPAYGLPYVAGHAGNFTAQPGFPASRDVVARAVEA